jgi:hypothetical protein
LKNIKACDELENRISEITDKEGQEINRGQLLFHYTTAAALINILSENKLWLSQRDFMNDVYDRTYADNILKEAFCNVSVTDGEKEYYEFKDRMMPEFHRQYVFSLTTESDLMSQWSYYGGTDGYCLGLTFESFIDELRKKNLGFSSGKVIYKKENQIQIFEMLINCLKELDDAIDEIDEIYYCNMQAKASSLIVLFHGLFKQQSNYTENEYRLIVTSSDSNLKKYRDRKGVLLPYLEIDFEDGVPIREITVGPGVDDDIAISGLQQFLDDRSLMIVLKTTAMKIR